MLAGQAVESGERWVQILGSPPASPARREQWMKEVSTIAAYRDRWHIGEQNPVGRPGNTISTEQRSQRQRALCAVTRATAISSPDREHESSLSAEATAALQGGIEL